MQLETSEGDEGQVLGLREKKRRDTLRRIAQTGLNLFIAKGYEETTLDEIAAAAGISRRTFFHYFTSKDEILLAWQMGVADSLRDALQNGTKELAPLDTLRGALMKLSAHFDTDAAVVVGRLLRSNAQLLAANQAKFVRMELSAFEGLCSLWPQRSRRERLRLVAMVGIGAFRLAIEQWTDDDGKVPLTRRIDRSFANLHVELVGRVPDGV
jgi:AcrR family transcriptional regulator